MNTIGYIIGSALKGKTVIQRTEIAGKLGISRRTLDSVVKGSSNLDLEQIGRLSDILGTDLFQQYFAKIGRKDLLVVQDSANPDYVVAKNEITVNLTLRANAESFGNFQTFLSEVRRLSAKHGYDLL